MSENPRTTEQWLYLGQRSPDGKKLYHYWRDESEQIQPFAKGPKPSAIAGCWYEVETTRTAETVSLVLTSPKFKRQHDDVEERQKIWAEHSAAVNSNRAMSVARETQLDDMTIEKLRARLRVLPTPQRRALLAVILERLGY